MRPLFAIYFPEVLTKEIDQVSHADIIRYSERYSEIHSKLMKYRKLLVPIQNEVLEIYEKQLVINVFEEKYSMYADLRVHMGIGLFFREIDSIQSGIFHDASIDVLKTHFDKTAQDIELLVSIVNHAILQDNCETFSWSGNDKSMQNDKILESKTQFELLKAMSEINPIDKLYIPRGKLRVDLIYKSLKKLTRVDRSYQFCQTIKIRDVNPKKKLINISMKDSDSVTKRGLIDASYGDSWKILKDKVGSTLTLNLYAVRKVINFRGEKPISYALVEEIEKTNTLFPASYSP